MEEVLCTGCLCSGRKLYFIGETGFYQLYSQILNEIPIQDLSQVCIRLCWECCALLHKFQLFKAQVKRNYTELLWNVPSSNPDRLTTNEVYNISYPDNDPSLTDQIKDEDVVGDIKTETEDVTEHQEPVAFVNEVSVEQSCHKSNKKSKKKPKEKRSSKNKIKVKKKKIHKEYENIPSDGISDAELPLEDDFDEDANQTEGIRICEEKKLEIMIEIPKVTSPKSHQPVLPVQKQLKKSTSLTKTPIVLTKTPNALTKTPKLTTVPIQLTKPKQTAELLPDKPQCVECGKTFSSRKTYRYHLNVLHKGNNRYPCPRCGKIYQWKSNLGRHMRTHKAVDAGELYCDTCDKSFASVATYRQHLRISRRHVTENEFSFTCNECGKKFVNKTRLRDHIDWEHLKKIKFRCNLCNKPFKCHTSLYVHLQNVHRNKEKKDNLCHVCGKSYQNAAKLKYHITALHTGETPYRCAQCAAAFGWYSSLYRHIREVHYKVKTQPKKAKKSKKMEIEQPIYNMNLQTYTCP